MKTLHLFSIIILLHISGIGLAQDTSKIALSIGGSEALMASPGFPFFIFNSNSYRIARTDYNRRIEMYNFLSDKQK